MFVSAVLCHVTVHHRPRQRAISRSIDANFFEYESKNVVSNADRASLHSELNSRIQSTFE